MRSMYFNNRSVFYIMKQNESMYMDQKSHTQWMWMTAQYQTKRAMHKILDFVAINKFLFSPWCAIHWVCKIQYSTRMHSSRMRTARAFTVCRSLLLGGVYLPGPRGVYLPGLGGYLPGLGRGCTCLVPGGCTCLVWGGVPAWSWGVYLVPEGGVPAWSRGVYLPGPGGVYLPGPGGCTWSGTPPRGQNDTRLWKYYLAPNFVCGR